MGLRAELNAARKLANSYAFETPEWEEAMIEVRAIAAALNAEAKQEEFCSVDSGEHRTRLLNGRIV